MRAEQQRRAVSPGAPPSGCRPRRRASRGRRPRSLEEPAPRLEVRVAETRPVDAARPGRADRGERVESVAQAPPRRRACSVAALDEASAAGVRRERAVVDDHLAAADRRHREAAHGDALVARERKRRVQRRRRERRPRCAGSKSTTSASRPGRRSPLASRARSARAPCSTRRPSAAGRSARSRTPNVVDEREPRLDSRHAGGLRRPVRRPRAMVGRDDVDRRRRRAPPTARRAARHRGSAAARRANARARRRSAAPTARSTRPCEVTSPATARPRASPARPRAPPPRRKGGTRAGGRPRAREHDRAVHRFALALRRARVGEPSRPRLALGREPPRRLGDHVVVLGVEHREAAARAATASIARKIASSGIR